MPLMARIGPMLTIGLDGPMTTSSASASATSAAGLGRALQWWLGQLASPLTRRALLERHAGPLS